MIGAMKFLEKLEPTKLILGIVPLNGAIGLSVSDPYLSFARPLKPDNPFKINNIGQKLPLLLQEQNIGGVLVGKRMSALVTSKELLQVSAAEQKELIKLLSNVLTRHNIEIACTVSDLDCDREHYEKEMEDNLLWETLNFQDDELSDVPADHSALSLQVWLDKHCGGWSNTFG